MIALLLAAALSLPNPSFTPGVVRPLSKASVCSTAWGKDRRHVSAAMKRQVFASYGIPWSEHARYEVDHLVPRELAGADDVRNLWPQIWPEARRKDALETAAHRDVCAGRLSLRVAQAKFRNRAW